MKNQILGSSSATNSSKSTDTVESYAETRKELQNYFDSRKAAQLRFQSYKETKEQAHLDAYMQDQDQAIKHLQAFNRQVPGEIQDSTQSSFKSPDPTPKISSKSSNILKQ